MLNDNILLKLILPLLKNMASRKFKIMYMACLIFLWDNAVLERQFN